MTDEVFLQLARDAFLRIEGLPLDLQNGDHSRWASGYVAALKDSIEDRERQSPGLLSRLLDLVDEMRRENAKLKGSGDRGMSIYAD